MKYFAKREVRKRLGLKEIDDPKKEIERIEGVLKKKGLLTKDTRDVAYSLLGDAYATYAHKIGTPSKMKIHSAESQEYQNTSFNAAQAYARAGQFDKAKEILKTKIDNGYNEMARGWDNLMAAIRGGTKLKHIDLEGASKVIRLITQEERNRERSKGLEKRVRKPAAVTAAIIGIIGAIFFLSSNITGNVIGNLTNSTSNIIGVVLLCAGLVTGFFYFKNKKK